MEGVILFAHGSLLCGAGATLQEHAKRLRERGAATIAEVGFLNYSEPSFSEAVARCVSQGARRILVTPYFLVPGKFVRVDLPLAVDEAKGRYPNIEFVIAEPIGYEERLADALIEAARNGRPPDAWGEDLERASAYCQNRPECPLFHTAACGVRDAA